MTVGQLFIDLVRLLEIGSVTASKKRRSIIITPYYGEELSVSRPKRALVFSIQQAFTTLRASKLPWLADLSIEQQLWAGEIIRIALLKVEGFSLQEIEEAEIDLTDALQSLYNFRLRRESSKSPS